MSGWTELVKSQLMFCYPNYIQHACLVTPRPSFRTPFRGTTHPRRYSYMFNSKAEPELSAAAAAIVDRFFGEDYEDQSDLDEESGASVGGHTAAVGAPFGGHHPPQDPASQSHAAGMGRGSHLTRPSWMTKN